MHIIIQDFFARERIYSVVNCTLVILIPKSSSAKTMRKLRPIYCCTTLYMIISNILTTRLSRVINEVVNESQSGFIPSKLYIHDNILIAHELLKGYNRKGISPRCAIQMELIGVHWG